MSTSDLSGKWAELRFAVIGELLTRPPRHGELQKALKELEAKTWLTPSGEWKSFSLSTIERWYYKAKQAQQPFESLRRKVRSDAGCERVMSDALLEELRAQFATYPTWSYQLHADNLRALVEERPELGSAPSATTVRRRMQKRGWHKRPKARTEGQKLAQQRLDSRETRGFEVEYVHAVWHFDYHQAKKKVLLSNGIWVVPHCLCILDDCSRYVCHIQWYYEECAETLSHGMQQAFMKRGLPRGWLSDNGSAMKAAETQSAARELSIDHNTTLPYSPHQNGKQEAFWDQIEGRLMPMLSNVEVLTLELLNKSTLAWVELEYNREHHEEIGMSPLEKLLKVHDVSRPSCDAAQLRFHFTRTVTRVQRRGDGTVSIAGVRFEVPGRMRHVERLTLRYASWDLSRVYIVDPRHSTTILATILPQDKLKNANGRRRLIGSDINESLPPQKPKEELPPLMRKILREFAATGLPAAFIPHTPSKEEK